jgi:hypothetical protein
MYSVVAKAYPRLTQDEIIRCSKLSRANRNITNEHVVDAKCFIGNLRPNQKFLAPHLQIKISIRNPEFFPDIVSEQKAKYQISISLSGGIRKKFQRRV